MNHVGDIIVEGRIVACDPKELALDDNFGETKVDIIDIDNMEVAFVTNNS
jgi:hypothetical protein